MRYADDLVVVCKTKQHAELAEWDVRKYLARLELELHPDKTRRVELYDGKQGFDFLGCHFRKRLSGVILEREGKRKYFLHRQPSQRSMKRIREKVRDKTQRGRCHADLREVIADLNPVLRRWGAYFGTGNAHRSFVQIDDYVRERLVGLRRGRAPTSKVSVSIACAEPSSIRRLPSTAGPRALPQAECGKSASTVFTGVVRKLHNEGK